MGSKEKGTDMDKGKNQVVLMRQNEITKKWIYHFQRLGKKMEDSHKTVQDTPL